MRHSDKENSNVILTLFPHVMQTYHKKRNPNPKKQAIVTAEFVMWFWRNKKYTEMTNQTET